jgi:hypothetical protein
MIEKTLSPLVFHKANVVGAKGKKNMMEWKTILAPRRNITGSKKSSGPKGTKNRNIIIFSCLYVDDMLIISNEMN